MIIRISITVALLLIGLFLQPFERGILDFIFRILIFGSIIYLCYNLLFKSSKEKKGNTSHNDSDNDSELNKSLPSELMINDLGLWKFSDLLNGDEKIREIIINHFQIISDIVVPENGWLLYKYKDTDIELIRYKNFHDSNLETDHDCLNTGLMQILADRDQILIENNIKNTLNAIPCYDSTNYTPGSFLGIPIKLSDDEKLIVTFDAAIENHFNVDDKSTLDKISDNMVFILHSRLKSVKFLLDLKTNEQLIEFAGSLNSTRNLSSAIDLFLKKIWHEIESDRITFSMLSHKAQKGQIKKLLGTEDDFGENYEFPLEEGLTGWIISKNKPYLIDDMVKGEYFIPRFSKNETSNFGFRSFLGLPVCNHEKVIGAITIENKEPSKYSEEDKNLIKKYTSVFNTTLNRFAG